MNHSEAYKCAYCGESANTSDHVIPRSYLSTRKQNGAKERTLGFTVPTCGQCNSLLGTRIFKNLVDRKQWLYKRLKKRLKKQTNLEFWDTDEMDELGPNMKNKVETSMATHEIAWDRLDYAREPPEPWLLRREARWRAKMDVMSGDLIAAEGRCKDWQESHENVFDED